ncbi:hypothetical protein F385_1201 [Pantoea agglomerans 299R]|nr:hypothetical protein F385_1201 [Pantoea agglomerans 299R]
MTSAFELCFFINNGLAGRAGQFDLHEYRFLATAHSWQG